MRCRHMRELEEVGIAGILKQKDAWHVKFCFQGGSCRRFLGSIIGRTK